MASKPDVKTDNPNVIGIKHMAFAVKDANAALASYARFLCVRCTAFALSTIRKVHSLSGLKDGALSVNVA